MLKSWAAASVRCLLGLLVAGVATPLQGATYYLNTTSGAAVNPGTSSQPWKTLDQVRSQAHNGDLIVIQSADAATYAAEWPNHVSYKAKVVQQFGITWTFDRDYAVGQFVNGDFWVVGPVTIVGIAPGSTSVGGRIKNGSMVNPSPTANRQGYDNSMPYNDYDAALNVAYNCSAANPLALAPHSSLVSTISIEAAGNIPQLQRAAILTVLPSPAAPGSFRPPYCGTDKTIRFNESSLNYSLLKTLQPVSDTPTLASVEAMFAAPWIDHQGGWTGRMHHPSLSMPNYGQEMHRNLGIGALMLHLNFTTEQKRTLLCRYAQVGIDFHGIVKAGGIWNWSCDGGHAGGRKWPILFAGLVLNDSEMKAIGQKSGDYLYQGGFGPGNVPPDYVRFGEDDQTFYVTAADVAVTNGPSFGPDSRDAQKIPYTAADIGLPEWGIRHSTHPGMSNKWWPTIYRSVAGPPFHGTALAALLTSGGKELWNHNAYFDYTDRYMATTASGGEYPGWRTLSGFTANMWDAYRAQCGAVWPQTQSDAAPVLSLIGNKQVETGQTLTFTVTATDAGGDTLTYSASGLPAGATFTNRVFAWTPTAGSVGNHQVTFAVSDGQDQDSETITITVSQPNAAPVLGSIGNKSTNEGQALSFTLSATDADGDSLAYSAAGLPSGASFSGQTFTWTPGFSQAGAYTVTFTASDGAVQDSETITISVANVNRAPALAAIGDRSVDEANTLALALSAADPDGTGLTYSATGLPSGATFSGQSFSWTPAAGQAGSHQITFTVSDGALSDSETITVTVVGADADTVAPVVARQSPAPDAIQVPLNNLVTFHLTDAGQGINAGSVIVTLDGQTIYQGNTPLYTSALGRCIRSGSKNDYEFTYQHDDLFDFDHEVLVTVHAADLAGNAMTPATYSFSTEMRAFGSNRRVSKTSTAAKGAPVTVSDTAGTIWTAWHAGPVGARDIYVARMPAGQDSFDTPVQVTNHSLDQCCPDLALAPNGTLYLVWQDNRRGHWDIYASVGTNSGRTFSRETAVIDANDNQTAPTVVVDGASPSRVYVAWQDDRDGNQDIYVAQSANAFASSTVSRVTTNAADQTEPDMAVGAGNTVYLVWTDKRSGQADLYGAASNASWTNIALVTGAGDQTGPAVAVTPGGSALHLLWVDNASGDADIHYASSNGLPSSPLTGVNIVDDTTGAAQTAPAVACDASGKVFACWQDNRNIGSYGSDTDVYFTELSDGAVGTNVLVGESGARGNQTEPAIALNADSQPYIVWTDYRNLSMEIYCAATTHLDSTPLYAGVVNAASQATIGSSPTAIRSVSDVSVVVPAGACQGSVRVTISKILNPVVSPIDCLGSYDFGPSGIEFSQPVTVTIPYQVSVANRRARAYWYNSMTGALSQQGITDIENITISGTLYALRFKTTHFTPYYLVASDSEIAASESGGGGGGCSMSATGDGSPRHLLVPYAVVVVFMAILRRRDRKKAMRSLDS